MLCTSASPSNGQSGGSVLLEQIANIAVRPREILVEPELIARESCSRGRIARVVYVY
jgi:DNA-binding LacI/PurR family transcriptional regulator